MEIGGTYSRVSCADLPGKLANILGSYSAEVWRCKNKSSAEDTRADVVILSAGRDVAIGVYFYHPSQPRGIVRIREHYNIADYLAHDLRSKATFKLVAKNVVFK